MRLECLTSGSPECPLVRLYDFQPHEAADLLTAINSLASAAAERIEVHDLPFVESVGGCRLVFTRQHTIEPSSAARTEMSLTVVSLLPRGIMWPDCWSLLRRAIGDFNGLPVYQEMPPC